MAPGGHVGRFVMWTGSAFKKLDALYGTWSKQSQLKVDFNLPQPMMTNSDLGRLLKAFEIQSVIRPPIKRQPRRKIKKNPLKNIGLMSRLNPFAPVQKRKTLLQQLKGRRSSKDVGQALPQPPRLGLASNALMHPCARNEWWVSTYSKKPLAPPPRPK